MSPLRAGGETETPGRSGEARPLSITHGREGREVKDKEAPRRSLNDLTRGTEGFGRESQVLGVHRLRGMLFLPWGGARGGGGAGGAVGLPESFP